MAKLALLPSTQEDFYASIRMTERAIAEDTARWAKGYLDAKGVECQIFTGQMNSGYDAAMKAIGYKPSHLISIHYDSGSGLSNHTLMIFAFDRDIPFAQRMLTRICARLEHQPRPLMHRGPPDGGKPWPSQINEPGKLGIPSLMAEMADMGNDAAKIRDPAWRRRAGEAVAEAYLEEIGYQPQGQEEEVYLYAQLAPEKSDVPETKGWLIYNIPGMNIDWWLNISSETTPGEVVIFVNPQPGHAGVGGISPKYGIEPTSQPNRGLHKKLRDAVPGMSVDWSEVSIHANKQLSITFGN